MELLRHTLATLAYRGERGLSGAPAEFAVFPGAVRTPGEILAHIGDLGICWTGRCRWRMARPSGKTRLYSRGTGEPSGSSTRWTRSTSAWQQASRWGLRRRKAGGVSAARRELLRSGHCRGESGMGTGAGEGGVLGNKKAPRGTRGLGT